MLDIKFIRENKELIQAGAKKKHITFDVDKLITADDERRKILADVEQMRTKQNEVSDIISSAPTEERARLISTMKELKDELQKKEEALVCREKALESQLMNLKKHLNSLKMVFSQKTTL